MCGVFDSIALYCDKIVTCMLKLVIDKKTTILSIVKVCRLGEEGMENF